MANKSVIDGRKLYKKPKYVWAKNSVKNVNDRGIYHSLRPTILFANIFGMTTMTNVTMASTKSLRFHWLNLRTVYSAVVLSFMIFIAILSVVHFVSSVSTDSFNSKNFSDVASRLGAPCFYISATLSFTLVLNVSRHLPRLFGSWDEAVARLTQYPGAKKRNWTTDEKGCCVSVQLATVISVVFMSSAAIEHTFHDVYFFSTANCTGNVSFVVCCLDPINEFVRGVLGPDQNVVTIVAYVINKYANFAWNFHDLLLIQISLRLAFNFKVISKQLRDNCLRKSDIDGRMLREDHQALCNIARDFDEILSPIVLLSYAINVFFLAKQIHMGLRLSTRSLLEIGYAITSFVHLVGRLIAVTVSASAFHEQATDPIVNLLDYPSDLYDLEVKRFIDHITFNDIGFTGWKMFVVNRRLFLAIVSVIFTYELLLLDTS